jgi:hypothetical protein
VISRQVDVADELVAVLQNQVDLLSAGLALFLKSRIELKKPVRTDLMSFSSSYFDFLLEIILRFVTCYLFQ